MEVNCNYRQFSDLSNEIVLEISKYVQPRDLDNFFATSKRIRQLNAAQIPEHIRLKRQYGFLSNHYSYTEPYVIYESVGRYTGSLAKLLKDIIDLPYIACYVEAMSLKPWQKLWDDERFPQGRTDQRRDDTLSEPNKGLFQEAMVRSKYISGFRIEELMGRIEAGDEGQILGLLLALLPNLCALDLCEIDDWHNDVIDTIDAISADPKANTLTSLTNVTLSDADHEVPLWVVQMFASLPSMRQIRADSVHHEGQYLHAPSRRSKVTHLSLKQCQIYPEPLFKFLSFFDSLVAFEYTEDERLRGQCDWQSKPFWIRTCLDYHARRSLKRLVLRSCCAGNDGALLDSVRTFEVLEELDTNLEALIIGGADGTGEITERLPASIQKVILRHDSYTGDGHLRLVFNVLVLGKQALPHLKLLSFRPNRNEKSFHVPACLVAACESAGFTLTLD